MSKHSGKKDREDKARRRLVRAQLGLHAAQEKRAHAITRAEQEIEQARQRGSKWVAAATERVERRSGAMARAEAHLLAMTAPKHPTAPPAARAPADADSLQQSVPLSVSSPTAAADLIERRESEVAAQGDSSPLTIPDRMEIDSPSASNGNETPEEGESHPW
jgi:tRNA U34 5-carboxymethylaminomethyl modifying enzyme MnmG/GidA